jgi:hypothetical protein
MMMTPSGPEGRDAVLAESAHVSRPGFRGDAPAPTLPNVAAPY